MAEYIKELTLDVGHKNMLLMIPAKQYDYDSRFLRVQLTKDGVPFAVENTAMAVIVPTRPDCTTKAFSCEIEDDGRILVPLTYWTVELEGLVSAYISVVDANGRKISTLDFTIIVERSNYNGAEISPDEPQYDIIMQVIASENVRVANEEARISAEAERVNNEKARVNNEKARVDNENVRIENEGARKALHEEMKTFFDGVENVLTNKNVEQELGDSEEKVLSQKAATNLFDVNHSINILDMSKVTVGAFAIGTTGSVSINDAYILTDYIEVKEGDTIRLQANFNGKRYDMETQPNILQYRFVAAYDANKNILPNYAGTTALYTVQGETKFIRVTLKIEYYNNYQNAAENYSQAALINSTSNDVLDFVEPHDTYILKKEYLPNVTHKEPFLSVSADTLTSGNRLILGGNLDVKKNNMQVFSANVDTFEQITVGHGTTEFTASYIVIDNTNVSVYYVSGSAVLAHQAAHGLNISGFINVIIDAKEEKANFRISTATGTFSLKDIRWFGCNGEVYALSTGSTLNNCKLTWTCADLDSDVWVFGDSYLSFNASRFPYYILNMGFKNWLACGYSGSASEAQYIAYTKLLELGTPKYAVWCLGMNNPDSGAINASYLTNTQAFIAKCEENGIIPIISTIPSCWGSTAEDSDITVTRDNSYKTAWVRASGYRYIDFADAVEQAGGGWYEGMLSADGVHPTELGAVTLANRFILDFPEIYTTM